MSLTNATKVWLPGAMVFGLIWGCSEAPDITGIDGAGDPINFSREMTLGELQDALVGAPARLEIELIGDGPVAQRVVLGNLEAKHESEAIESRVTDIEIVGGDAETAGDDGILTLILGDLQVSFDSETSFRIGDDELGFDGFVNRVEGMLAEGFEPWVRAMRPPPESPQDPSAAAFHAQTLKLREEGESQKIEINVDVDNLALNTDPQDGEPDGWVHVLGLSIELRVSDGVTEIGTEDVDISDIVEFEGIVTSVNLNAGTFQFSDGTVVKVIDGQTQIFETEFDIQLLSLEAVHEALEAGQKVVAWGAGEVESKEPRVLIALELRFAVHTEGGGDKDHVSFEGYVTSVDFETSSFTLKNGTVVVIAEHTELITVGDGELLASLEEVQAALDAGDEVVAWGAGEVQSVEPLTIVACEMRFLLKPASNYADFEGYVETVDLEGLGVFTLADGTVVLMVEATLIKQAEQGKPLMSLAAVQEALEGGNDVIAWGEGEKESTEPLTISALKVWFVLAN